MIIGIIMVDRFRFAGQKGATETMGQSATESRATDGQVTNSQGDYHGLTDVIYALSQSELNALFYAKRYDHRFFVCARHQLATTVTCLINLGLIKHVFSGVFVLTPAGERARLFLTSGGV